MIKIVSDSSALYSKKDGQAKGVTIAPLIVTIKAIASILNSDQSGATSLLK